MDLGNNIKVLMDYPVLSGHSQVVRPLIGEHLAFQNGFLFMSIELLSLFYF